MKTSARNQYRGSVVNIRRGAVNDEVEVFLDGGGTRITSVITNTSSRTLGLEPGKSVVVLIKAPWVILVLDPEGVKFSAGNDLPGTVISVKGGAVNTEVNIRLDGGEPLTAIITESSAKNMGLKAGDRVLSLVKASNVILGVEQ
ncbi:MAG: TOBE domain-containing protein [Synergistaceae bacterium]|jgi:molybdate transport system regulatory protein|nr:TOBE domain-containing protein [Synergistaceae bacterium]